MELTLATYNIHRCIGTDKVQDPERIGCVIQEINPDIIALQEVEYINTVEELGFTMKNEGYKVITGPTVTSQKSKYGNILLSRYPVLNVQKINLSYPGQEQRGAIDIDINCKGSTLRVLATHLGLAPIERREQTRVLLRSIDNPQREKSPTILMGDMNEWFLWGRPLRWFHQYFGYRSTQATFPSRFPLFSLDKIWCHPPELVKKIAPHKSNRSRVASDHLPLTATISL